MLRSGPVVLLCLLLCEPGIDDMPRRPLGKLTLGGALWEAITAHSHHPDYPAEIAVQPEREKAPR